MSRESFVVLGVDGGGTKTALVAVDGRGRVLGRARCEGLNYNAVPMARCRAALREGVDKVLQAAGLSRFDCLSVGLSALDTRATPEEKRAFLGEAFPGIETYLHSDVHMALVAATQGEPGVMVVSGTGAMCVALDAAGDEHILGGWGYLFGDEGSGYDIALKGLLAAVHAYEGIAEATAIADGLLRRFEVGDLRELIPRFYRPPLSVSEIAALAVEVFSAAREGDAVARAILEDTAERLATQAARLAEGIGRVPCPVAIYGGSFEHNPMFVEAFAKRLQRRCDCTIGFPRFPPEIGAVIYALRQRGMWTPEILEGLDGAR